MALAKFQPYRSRFLRQWRSRFRASNGKILFVSSEGYWNRGDCLRAIEVMVAEIQKGAVIEASGAPLSKKDYCDCCDDDDRH